MFPLAPLSPLEVRALGVLAEKQLTTPNYYPLTLNALVTGCNQKSNRDPVIQASEAEVQAALESLKRQTLVIESYGASGRVMRYAHNLPKVLNLGQQMTALLAVLMLRGPQTAGELRIGCDRLYSFADISSVEAFLGEMTMRPTGALVVKLPKQPGSREHRWAHTLSAVPDYEAKASAPDSRNPITIGEIAALNSALAQLRDEVAQLRALVERLYQRLGVSP